MATTKYTASRARKVRHDIYRRSAFNKAMNHLYDTLTAAQRELQDFADDNFTGHLLLAWMRAELPEPDEHDDDAMMMNAAMDLPGEAAHLDWVIGMFLTGLESHLVKLRPEDEGDQGDDREAADAPHVTVAGG